MKTIQSNPHLVRCWIEGCHATKGSDGTWPVIVLSDETLTNFSVSHGVCPKHYAEAMAQLQAEKEDLCKHQS